MTKAEKAQQREWRSFLARRAWNTRRVRAEIEAARAEGLPWTRYRPLSAFETECRPRRCGSISSARKRSCSNPVTLISYSTHLGGFVVSCQRCRDEAHCAGCAPRPGRAAKEGA